MKREYQVSQEELQVVDGKVVISSDELVAAIQNQEFDLSEMNEEDKCDLNICIIIGKN